MKPLSQYEIICYIILFIACILSSAAGIGGGSINVSIFLVIGRFKFKDAIMLSFCTLLGNLLFQVIINLLKDHPLMKGRPLIYWEIILLFVPSILSGSNIGMILAKILPESGLLLLATVCLGSALIYSAYKTLALYRAESIEGSKFLRRSSPFTADLQAFMNEIDAFDSDIYEFESMDESELVNKNLLIKESNEQLKKLNRTMSVYSNNNYEGEYDFPWTIIIIIISIWIAYAIMYVLLSLISDCTWEYYQICLGYYPLLALVLYFCLKYLQWRQDTTNNIHAVGDINFHEFSLLVCVLVAIIGVLCSLLGLGGGELLGPLLLWLKVLPQSSSASTGVISLFNAASTVIYYIANQRIPYTHGLYSFLAGSLGGLTGRLLALKLAEILGRPSILAVCLTIVLGISCFMNFYEFVTTTINFEVRSLCSSHQ